MALETLNNRYGIRHFDEGGSTDTPTGTVTVTGAPANMPNDPIAGLYQSTFNRAPDAGGLAYWQNALNTGTPLADIQNAFKSSQEAQALPVKNTTTNKNTYVNTLGGTGANLDKDFVNPNPTNVVQNIAVEPMYGSTPALTAWYQTNLGRAPDLAGLNYWSKAFGSSLDPNEIAQLQASPEYKNRQAITGYYDTEIGHAPDKVGLDYWTGLAGTGTSLADIQKSISATPEGQKFDLKSLYTNELGRDIDPLGLKYWQDKLAGGASLADIKKEINNSKEGIVAQDYFNYTGRKPDAAGSKYWQDQLAAGKTKDQIAHEIALSNESVAANSASVKANLEAVLGKDVVASMTPAQIDAYTRIILDPTRQGTNGSQYATQADNLKEVYKQIALDPILGAKLKAADPNLYAKVTPLENITGAFNGGASGTHGTMKVGGVDVPILSAQVADSLLQGTTGTKNNVETGTALGWAGGGVSSKISKGADALGVEKVQDEDGNLYGYNGLNEAADLLKIDKSQFKDKYEPILTKDVTDANGYVVSTAGQPVYQKDSEGNTIYGANGQPVPAMRTITANDQLYDAVNAASQDLYLFTGANLDQNLYNVGTKGNQSFQTTFYQKSGDKLIPISKPQAHGGIVANSDLGGGDEWKQPLMMAVAIGAAAFAPQISAYLVGTMGTVGAAIATGVIVGAGVGAANATISGTSVGQASLKGGAVGGVTAGVTAGLAQGLDTAFPPTIAADGTKVANSIFTGASDMMSGAISPTGVQSVVTQTLARTLVGAITPGASGDKILQQFGTALVSSGLSVAASEQIVNQLKDSGFDKDNIAKLARTVQLAVNTGSTAALSGKSSDQILNSIITGVIAGGPSIAKVTGEPPKIEPTNPFGTENVGMTSGSVDKVLQSQIMDGIANKTDDPIAFMNAAKNWTGDGSKNVEYVTTAMVKQGISADQISKDLQDLYRIPADKADEYAKYMVTKVGPTVKPTPVTTTTTTTTTPVNTTTTTQQPTNTAVTQTNAPVTNTTPPSSGGTTTQPLISGMSYTPSAASPGNQLFNQMASSTGNQNPVNLTTSGAGGSNMAFLGQTLPYAPAAVAASGVGGFIPTLAEVGSALDPLAREAALATRVLGGAGLALYPSELGSGTLTRDQIAAQDAMSRLPPSERTTATTGTQGKPTGVDSFSIPSSVTTPVAPPQPIRGEAAEAPSGFSGVPVLPSPGTAPVGDVTINPANEGQMFNPNAVPRADTFTPRGDSITASPTSPKPGQVPLPITPLVPGEGTQPAIKPEIQPAVKIDTVTDNVVTPQTKTEAVVTPQVQTAIQTVARTQAEAVALTQAVPMVVELINTGIPRTVAIPQVATKVGVPVQDLTAVIDVAVPDVNVTPTTVTPPTVTTPTPKTSTPKTPTAPTTTVGKTGVISPFLLQQYGGIQDLSPGLTGGGNYSLSGIPSTNTNMNPMTPNSPLPQFASTSPPSPLELGAQQQPNEPMQMATGGSTSATSNAYNPYDVSTGISGSLTPGLTKARLDYLLTGLPQSHAEGGTIGHNPQFFSEGGLGSMNNTFVKGNGDGTSDSVPAMLANGEFVIPADIVSGLGNGSNDAGAQVLQEFLKVIREHKHSAKANKLPPKSKGPLAYLTNAKRKVKVA